MNARKLKYAFLKLLPVCSTDKKSPVKNGYVLSVIYSLGSSGKVRCDAELRDLDNPREVNKTSCRHVHFKGDPKDIDAPPPSGVKHSEHAEGIRQAFKNGESVMVAVPGTIAAEYSYISALVYTRGRKGNIICSCVLVDSANEKSTLQARIRYVFRKDEYAEMEKGR